MFVCDVAFVTFFGLEENLASFASEKGRIVNFVLVPVPMRSRCHHFAAYFALARTVWVQGIVKYLLILVFVLRQRYSKLLACDE